MAAEAWEPKRWRHHEGLRERMIVSEERSKGDLQFHRHHLQHQLLPTATYCQPHLQLNYEPTPAVSRVAHLPIYPSTHLPICMHLTIRAILADNLHYFVRCAHRWLCCCLCCCWSHASRGRVNYTVQQVSKEIIYTEEAQASILTHWRPVVWGVLQYILL